MIRGDLRGRFSEDDTTSLLESPDPFERTHDTDEMFPSSADKSGRYYSQTLFGPFVSSKSVEGSGSNSNRLRKLTPKMPSRYGASGSFDLETLSTEGADGVCTNSEGGYDETYSFTWGPDILTNWIRPNLMSFGRSRSLFSDSSRETEYSTSFGDVSDSSSLYSSSHSRPVLIGSRGKEIQRGMQRNHCGRGAVEPVDRGNGVGCSTQCPSCCKERYFSNSAALVFRGTKRKMMEPIPPCKVVKKKRIIRAARSISSSVVGSNISKSSYTSPDKETNGERVDGKKVRAREKRRRRREKNHEKYGDKHRWAFTCAFCKFHTFEDKDIEKHFGSTYHKETLDYIRRQAKFDDGVISFLHDCMVHKFRKTVSTLHKLNSSCARSKDEWPKIMEGVTEDDYMRRMEVVYCVACDTHIPVLFSSVQQHLNSLTHLKSKMAYKEQLKRDSVVTAKAIINNDNVKVRYEKYMKGEDPFAADTRDTSSDSQEQERSDEDDAEDSSS